MSQAVPQRDRTDEILAANKICQRGLPGCTVRSSVVVRERWGDRTRAIAVCEHCAAETRAAG